MTQGARTKKLEEGPNPDLELDLDAWLAKRGLIGEKRMKVGGKWFRFVGSGTSEQIAKYNSARQGLDLRGMLAALLVDPTEADELAAAFALQRQPLESEAEQQWLKSIINFLIAGDLGESSAS